VGVGQLFDKMIRRVDYGDHVCSEVLLAQDKSAGIYQTKINYGMR
jgi:hypothetical protein